MCKKNVHHICEQAACVLLKSADMPNAGLAIRGAVVTNRLFVFFQVISDGLISFGEAVTWSTPGFLPTAIQSTAIIAPFWSDVNTTTNGRIYYRTVTSTCHTPVWSRAFGAHVHCKRISVPIRIYRYKSECQIIGVAKIKLANAGDFDHERRSREGIEGTDWPQRHSPSHHLVSVNLNTPDGLLLDGSVKTTVKINLILI